ncbi:ATP-binding protein [Limibacter armeniacum]|uniref:ATP-binding protein n=1 Tax=Limibacter armeniacum TaxID=466084 RepID=UPI002FE67C8E
MTNQDRYLKKLIFINSASLPYSEVEVEGNIHFVGSNGFGKTTVLRAILFFYNPTSNKADLGIRENQRSFSDYYFEQLNSYIIYEVAREEGDYCIVCYKHGGRLQFRILDSGYDPSIFITEERQVLLPETVWETCNNREIRHSEEPIIKYGDLRNIIYGSTLLRRYRNYGLLQARSGQVAKRTTSIPKAIANIFKTSSLNSDYIKKSIIDAVVEEEQKPIDLTVIERHLKKFREELNALETFERQRETADELIELYYELIGKEKELDKVANLLGLAAKATEKQLKLDKNKRDQLEITLHDIEQAFEVKAQENEEEVRELNQQIGEPKSALKQIEQLKKQYASISINGEKYSIEEILDKVAEEIAIKDKITNLEATLRTLTAKAEEVQQLYTAQEAQLKGNFENFKLTTERELNNAKTEFHEKAEAIRIENAEKQKQSTVQLQKDLAAAEQDVDIRRLKVNELQLDKERAKIGSEGNSAIEIHQKKISEEAQKLTALKGEHELKKAALKNQRVLFESKKESLEQKLNTEEKVLLQERSNIEDKINLQQKRLEEFEGSLQDFLNLNVEGWENTIGKVCREEVLLSKGLMPEISDDSNNIFGIKLDLSTIDIKPQQADDFRSELEKLEKKLTNWHKKLDSFQQDRELQLRQLTDTSRQQVRQLDEEVQQVYAQLASSENKVKRLHLEMEELKDSHQSSKDTVIQRIEGDLQTAFTDLEASREVLQQYRDKLTQQQETFDKLKEEAIDKLKLSLEQQQAKAAENLEKYEAEFKKNLDELEANRNEQLHSSGVDTDKVTATQRQISALKATLELIEECKNWATQYKVHEPQLSKEAHYSQMLEELEERLQMLKSKFEQDKARHISETKSLREELQQVLTAIRDGERELYEDFAFFKQDHTSPYFLYAHLIDEPKEMDEAPDTFNLKGLVNKINTSFKEKNLVSGKLRDKTKKFTEKFPENNILNFPTKFSSVDDSEQRAFISSLLIPFVKEERFIQVREQIERQHGGIIRNIANEIQDLSSASSKISETIKQINGDFENSNFVGVVKSIQLDFRKNDSPIIRLLKRVKELEGQNVFGDQSEIFRPQSTMDVNKDSKKLLNELIKAIDDDNRKTISIQDNFDLLFRVRENNNDTNWVEKLSSVGSEGTDILVKSMIYITLLNVFKQNAFKNADNYLLHCMIDEVGKLSDSYLSDLIQFTNDKNIRLIFGSPNENDPLIYNHVYKIHRVAGNKAQVVKLVGEA